MQWILLHPRMTPEHLGFIPGFLSEDDERPAKEQIEANYVGGWRPMPGWEMGPAGVIEYRPNGEDSDPPLIPTAMTCLRDEVIMFYDHAWLVILQPNGSFEVSRVD